MSLRPKVKECFSYNSAALFLCTSHGHSLSPPSSFPHHARVGWCCVWKLLLLAWREQAGIWQGKAPRRVAGNPDASPAVETKLRSSELFSFIRSAMEAVGNTMLAFSWHFQHWSERFWSSMVVVELWLSGLCIGHYIWGFCSN